MHRAPIDTREPPCLRLLEAQICSRRGRPFITLCQRYANAAHCPCWQGVQVANASQYSYPPLTTATCHCDTKTAQCSPNGAFFLGVSQRRHCQPKDLNRHRNVITQTQSKNLTGIFSRSQCLSFERPHLMPFDFCYDIASSTYRHS